MSYWHWTVLLNPGLLTIVSCVTMPWTKPSYTPFLSLPELYWFMPFGKGLGIHGCLTAISFCSLQLVARNFCRRSKRSHANSANSFFEQSCGNLSQSHWYNRCPPKGWTITHSKVWAGIQLQLQSAGHSNWHHWFRLPAVLLNFHLQYWWGQTHYRNLFWCRHRSPMRNRSLRHCWYCNLLHCSYHKLRPQQPRSGEPTLRVESSTSHNPFKTAPNLSPNDLE